MTRTVLFRMALPFGVYVMVEWLFAYVTFADGLVTPHGAPHLGVAALGALYLGLRIVLRLVGPGWLVFVLAREVTPHLRRAALRIARRARL